MNSRRVNYFFLAAIILHFAAIALLVAFPSKITLSLRANFIISSVIVIIPALLFILTSGENWRAAINLRPVRLSSVVLIILFTYFSIPLTSLLNLLSMFFVQNAMEGMAAEMLSLPFAETFFYIAILGPIGEELAFRGLCYRGYLRCGTMFGSMVLSAVLFAFMHMNLNQAVYALVIGTLMVLLVEAADSILASVIYHIVFNGHTVILMYIGQIFMPDGDTLPQQSVSEYRGEILKILPWTLIWAVICTSVALYILYRIAKNEGRLGRLALIWRSRKDKRGKLVTVPLLLSLAVVLVYMITEAVLMCR